MANRPSGKTPIKTVKGNVGKFLETANQVTDPKANDAPWGYKKDGTPKKSNGGVRKTGRDIKNKRITICMYESTYAKLQDLKRENNIYSDSEFFELLINQLSKKGKK